MSDENELQSYAGLSVEEAIAASSDHVEEVGKVETKPQELQDSDQSNQRQRPKSHKGRRRQPAKPSFTNDGDRKENLIAEGKTMKKPTTEKREIREISPFRIVLNLALEITEREVPEKQAEDLKTALAGLDPQSRMEVFNTLASQVVGEKSEPPAMFAVARAVANIAFDTIKAAADEDGRKKVIEEIGHHRQTMAWAHNAVALRKALCECDPRPFLSDMVKDWEDEGRNLVRITQSGQTRFAVTNKALRAYLIILRDERYDKAARVLDEHVARNEANRQRFQRQRLQRQQGQATETTEPSAENK